MLSGYPCSDVFLRHLSFFVEHPCFSDDLLHDDLGKFALDVIELSSNSMILDISYVLCPLQNMGIAGSRSHAKVLVIPSVLQHVV